MIRQINIKIVSLILIALIALAPSIALASDISSALYYGTVQVVNTGTDATYVATNSSLTTPLLTAGGFVDSNADYTAVRNTSGADIPYMPGYSTNPWCFWIDAINADEYLNLILYTSDTDMSATQYYFPANNGMTTSDNASLEPSDNFSHEWSGWIDTSAGDNKYILQKDGATYTYVSPTVSGNITSAIATTFIPQGFSDPGTGWTDEAKAYDEDTGTWALSGAVGGGVNTSYLVLTTTSNITCGGVYFYIDSSVPDAADTITINVNYDSGFQLLYTGTFSVDTWTYKYIGNLESTAEIEIRFHNNAGAGEQFYVKEMYFVDYDTVFVSATGISSGDYTTSVNASPDSKFWATGSVLHYTGAANSEVDCGAINNAAAKLWVSLWFKLDNNFAAGSTTQYVYGKRIDSNNQIYAYLANADGKLNFYHISGGVQKFWITSSQSSWTAGTWYHVIFSTSNTAGVRMRINNGTAVTNADTTALPNGGNFVIGSRVVGGTSGFIGNIANVIIGTDDLTTAEETALYNGIAPADATDYWYIDEGTGTAITSYGTSANAGTAGASNSWQTSTYTGTSGTGRLADYRIVVDSEAWGNNIIGKLSWTVPDTANDIVEFKNNVMPYVEYSKKWIDGVLQQYIDWEYGAIFHNSAHGGDDATPTFRTSSSDADVSASLISFTPVSEARAPAYAIGESAVDVISDNVTMTGTFGTTTTPTFPGAAVITAVANASSTPSQLPLIIIIGFVILCVSLCASYFLFKEGNNSLIAKTIIIAIGMAFALGVDGFDFWMLIVFVIFLAPAFIISNRQAGW